MTITMPHARGVRGQRRTPRVNAPIRRYRRAGSAADVVIALGFGAMAMAAAVLAASTVGNTFTGGDAGETLARMFAGSLAAVGFIAFLLGLALLRESMHIGVRLLYAALLGVTIGVMETVIFIEAPGLLLGLPPALALLGIRYPRDWFLRGIGLLPRGDGVR